jgi:hypothetical protein
MGDIFVIVRKEGAYAWENYDNRVKLDLNMKKINIEYARNKILIFDVTFNSVDIYHEIKSSNDIAYITFSLKYDSCDKSDVEKQNCEYWKHVISKRLRDIYDLDAQRNIVMDKLTSINPENSNEISKMLEDIKTLSLQIGNHREEIKKIETSMTEITYEKKSELYRIDLPRNVIKSVSGIPEQEFSFKISWQVENEKQHTSPGVVKENLSVKRHNTKVANIPTVPAKKICTENKKA